MSSNGEEGEERKKQSALWQQGGIQELWNFFIWHGGSTVDAWFMSVTCQVGQVILSMPYSYSQMGFKLGIISHILFVTMGCWATYLLSCLYLEYRSEREIEGENFQKQVIQYHEVMGCLVGSWLKRITLCLNIISVGGVAAIQIIASASNAYYFNSDLDKRTWTLIFGAIFILTVLLPSFHNFRIWSIIGTVTTTYAAWFILTASISHGQIPNVKYSAPETAGNFFTGTSNILFAFGGGGITMEIMHAMWKPKKYKYVYIFTCIYVLTITMPHSVALYWAYGDELLIKSNAFAVLPDSLYKKIGLIAMLVHTSIAFASFVIPVFFYWEKVLGIHQAHYLTRTIVRIPVVLFLWMLALLVPFFGPLNSLFGSILLSFSSYIIPCVAYLMVFKTKSARENAVDKPPKWIPGWTALVLFNIFVIFTVLIIGAGFGSWASVSNIIEQVDTFGIFAKCYQCPKRLLFKVSYGNLFFLVLQSTSWSIGKMLLLHLLYCLFADMFSDRGAV